MKHEKNGSNSEPVATLEPTDRPLSLEEQRSLAGASPLALPEERLDVELPSQGWANSAVPRTVFVGGIIGSVCLVAFLFTMLFGGRQKVVEAPVTETETPAIAPDEKDKLKTELALVGQGQDQGIPSPGTRVRTLPPPVAAKPAVQRTLRSTPPQPQTRIVTTRSAPSSPPAEAKEPEQQIEQFSLLDAAQQPVVEEETTPPEIVPVAVRHAQTIAKDSVEFEPDGMAIQAALNPEARNTALGEVTEEEVPPTQVPLVINALTAEDQTVSEQAQLEQSTVAIAPIAQTIATERHSPTLEEMRNWRVDATLLGRNYEKRIKQLGNEMLQGEQAQLPREQRDPAFQNPDFTLSDKAYQAMQLDSSESEQMRTPTRGDLILWFQAAQLSGQDESVTDFIKDLGRQMIQGTEQEELAPKDRDTHFKNPGFVLTRQDFIAMKEAIAPLQNSLEEEKPKSKRSQLSV